MSNLFKNVNEIVQSINNEGRARLQVKVVSNSKINLLDFTDDYIKIKITARAVDGKANKAIIEYLSNIFNISKSKISIIQGEKNSIKLIEVLK